MKMTKDNILKAIGTDAWDKIKKLAFGKQEFVTAKTADGSEINFEPGMEQGATATINGQPVPDGTYTLESGATVMCAGGRVTEMKEPAAMGDDQVFNDLAVQMGKHLDLDGKVKEAVDKAIEVATKEKFAAVEKLESQLKDTADKLEATTKKAEASEKEVKEMAAAFNKVIDAIGEEEGAGRHRGGQATILNENMSKAEKIAAMAASKKGE